MSGPYVFVAHFQVIVELRMRFRNPLPTVDYHDSNGVGAFLERWSPHAVTLQMVAPAALARKKRLLSTHAKVVQFIRENWRDLLEPHDQDHGLDIVGLKRVVPHDDPDYYEQTSDVVSVRLEEPATLALLQQFAVSGKCPETLKSFAMLKTRAPLLVLTNKDVPITGQTRAPID
jgi:hypothetical protein